MADDHYPDPYSAFGRSAPGALALVGATVEQVVDALGSLADAGDVYLVGSLGAGLGNAGSDIDLHVILDDELSNGSPAMFFLGSVLIDLQCFTRQAIDEHLAGLDDEALPLCGGLCALGRSLPARDAKRLSRWVASMPIGLGSTPGRDLLSEADASHARSALARAMLDHAVSLAAIADLVDRSGRPSAFTWKRAGHTLLETVVSCRGDVFVGPKWLWSKARRSGVPEDAIAAAARCSDRTGWGLLRRRLGLPAFDAGEHTVLVWAGEAPTPVRFGSGDHLLVDGRRLVNDMCPPQLGEVLDLKPEDALRLVAEGFATNRVDSDAVDELVREAGRA